MYSKPKKNLTQLKLVENLKTKENINHDFCIQKNSTYINNMKYFIDCFKSQRWLKAFFQLKSSFSDKLIKFGQLLTYHNGWFYPRTTHNDNKLDIQNCSEKLNKSPSMSTLVSREVWSQFLLVIRSSITVIQHVPCLSWLHLLIYIKQFKEV